MNLWASSISAAAFFLLVGCSSAPTYMTTPTSEPVDFASYLTAEELALPREPGPPVSRSGEGLRYPDQALNFEEPGVVIVILTIGPDGRVIASRIASETPPHYGFGIAAEEWARRWTFAPAQAPKRIYALRQQFKVMN